MADELSCGITLKENFNEINVRKFRFMNRMYTKGVFKNKLFDKRVTKTIITTV